MKKRNIGEEWVFLYPGLFFARLSLSADQSPFRGCILFYSQWSLELARSGECNPQGIVYFDVPAENELKLSN